MSTTRDCRTGCRGACNQGRLPCPNNPADVAAMREMGIDLRPHRSTVHDCGRPQEHCSADGDSPIPLPSATITTPWPPSRGGVRFEPPRLDHFEAVAAAIDAGDRTHMPSFADVAQARQEGFDAGLRCGAESTSWWDTLAGLLWGAGLVALVMVLATGAGILSVRWG